MGYSKVPQKLPSCPERHQLEAFHAGNLPEPDLVALAAHATSCPRCKSTLAELHAQDTLLGRLKGCDHPENLLAEAGCARLEALARAISLSSDLGSPATLPDADPGGPWEPPLPAASRGPRAPAKIEQGGGGRGRRGRPPPGERAA